MDQEITDCRKCVARAAGSIKNSDIIISVADYDNDVVGWLDVITHRDTYRIK